MLYSILFLVRYFPFWALPCALVCFELMLYHFRRRERFSVAAFGGMSFLLVVLSVVWVIFEGYWRAGPWLKRLLEH